MTTETPTLDNLIKLYGIPDPKSVGKLPRTTCRACSNSANKVCDKHQKRECSDCGNYMTTAHMHLDYVGHAEITRILTEIDPMWTWAPLGVIDGAPAIRKTGENVEMWATLTLLGKSLIGVGSCKANKEDPGKELIGDFLRNAAMRFGIALSLWSKSEWEAVMDETPEPPATSPPQDRIATERTPRQVVSEQEVAEAAALIDPDINPGPALIAKFNSENKALTAARKVAKEKDYELPTSFQAVIDNPALTAALLRVAT